MKIENVEVFGFRSAFRGLRNPMNSWNKSDSNFWSDSPWYQKDNKWHTHSVAPELPEIGPEDLKLAMKLIHGGSEHRKFLRQIQIWMDITLPRYVLTELDTYKVATVRNSCSTMHKLGHTNLESSDFQDGDVLPAILELLNSAGEAYRNKTGYTTYEGMRLFKYDIVRFMKKHLPEGFLQKATYSMNYETALSMYFQRKNHRLPEWNETCEGSITSFISSLPYMNNFIEATKR